MAERKVEWQDGNFFEKCLIMSKIVVNRFYKNSDDKAALVDAGYQYLLDRVKPEDLTGEKERDFMFMFRKCASGITSYVKKHDEREDNFSTFLKNNDSDETVDKSRIAKIFSCEFEDNLNFYYLKEILKKFLSFYEPTERKIILSFLKYGNLFTVARDVKMRCDYVTEFVKGFQEDFANYLVQCGYLNDLSILGNSKRDKRREQTKIEKQRKLGLVGYESYTFDYKICKLLREEDNLTKYADCLNQSVEYIKNLIFHKTRAKFNLRDIQKLRLQFFKDFSFLELVEVS